jgi:hypothetical protein
MTRRRQQRECDRCGKRENAVGKLRHTSDCYRAAAQERLVFAASVTGAASESMRRQAAVLFKLAADTAGR